MIPFLAGLRLQLAEMRANADYWLTTLTNPLLAIVFLAIVRNAGRDDLLGHAVLAPALIGVWRTALSVAGEIIERDRGAEILEPTIATPARMARVVLGRISAVTAVGLVGFAESWLVALVVFGIAIPIPHPGAFVLAIVVTAFATAGTSVIMAAVFVLARSARTFQNSLSYPFYVLGGVLVPVTLLSVWIQPLSRLVYLSWASDLLRDSLAAGPIDGLWVRVAVIGGLGVAGFAAGAYLMDRILSRVRRLGTVTYA